MDEGSKISKYKISNVQEMTDLIIKVILENQKHARFSFYRKSQFLHISTYTIFARGVA